jgi:hypothetical protein
LQADDAAAGKTAVKGPRSVADNPGASCCREPSKKLAGARDKANERVDGSVAGFGSHCRARAGAGFERFLVPSVGTGKCEGGDSELRRKRGGTDLPDHLADTAGNASGGRLPIIRRGGDRALSLDPLRYRSRGRAKIRGRRFLHPRLWRRDIDHMAAFRIDDLTRAGRYERLADITNHVAQPSRRAGAERTDTSHKTLRSLAHDGCRLAGFRSLCGIDSERLSWVELDPAG